jgi:hypothetical protein
MQKFLFLFNEKEIGYITNELRIKIEVLKWYSQSISEEKNKELSFAKKLFKKINNEIIQTPKRTGRKSA